jgi:DNA-binding GntR family transcriptional regulator
MAALPKSKRPAADCEPATTPDRIAEALRLDIIAGRFPPGMRLKIVALAERYGTSAMPVREALRQLDGERLIELNAHRGAVVRKVTIGFVQDIYEVRAALEGILADSCARVATPADIQALEQGLGHWEAAATGADVADMLKANAQLHGRINAIGRNEEARALADRGTPLFAALRKQIGYGPDRLGEITDQHRAIIAAIAAGDAGAARRAAEDHVFSARDDFVRQLERLGSLNIAGAGKRG